MKDSSVLSNYSIVRSLAAEKVNKEVALNLLEDLLTLYIHVRTFSFVNQKKEKFKLEAKKQKMNSLRKSIKKSSSTLERVTKVSCILIKTTFFKATNYSEAKLLGNNSLFLKLQIKKNSSPPPPPSTHTYLFLENDYTICNTYLCFWPIKMAMK